MNDQRVAYLKRQLDLGVREEDGNIPCVNFPDAYYPQFSGNTDQYSTLLVKQAIRGCMECPLMTRCADYALEAGEEHGIWGGLTVRQRKAMNKARLRTRNRVAS